MLRYREIMNSNCLYSFARYGNRYQLTDLLSFFRAVCRRYDEPTIFFLDRNLFPGQQSSTEKRYCRCHFPREISVPLKVPNTDLQQKKNMAEEASSDASMECSQEAGVYSCPQDSRKSEFLSQKRVTQYAERGPDAADLQVAREDSNFSEAKETVESIQLCLPAKGHHDIYCLFSLAD